MAITFDEIERGATYGRNELATRWGYASYHAIARGVVTPANDTKIVLFITRTKQRTAFPYRDKLEGNRLIWEGPTDHFGEERILNAKESGDEIHLFYRDKHHTDFTYLGRSEIRGIEKSRWAPARFILQIV
jgi:hypothetical protein